MQEIEAEVIADGDEAVAEMDLYKAKLRLANQLIARRIQLKLTQTKLARLSGVNQAEISKIEGARSNPTVETLCALGRVLGCELSFVRAVQTDTAAQTSVSS